MRMARELCPEALVIRGNSANYSKHSHAVTDIVREAVPVCEKSSIDEFYADLTGMDRFFGCWQYARELRERIIRETGLPISFGLSENKTVSKVATGEAKPNNALRIERGTERPFLAPLGIRKIPMVGEKTYQTLRNLGVRRIGTLQEMPVDMMERVLGKSGRTIWRKAQGEDPTPVMPTSDRKSISTERTFRKDTTDTGQLRGILIAMAENLAFQLRRGNKLTACITVKVRYSDFDTRTLQARIPYTAADHRLVPKALEMFEQLYDRRVLVRLVGVPQPPRGRGHANGPVRCRRRPTGPVPRHGREPRALRPDHRLAASLGARTIGRTNPFSGDAPLLLANRHQ